MLEFSLCPAETVPQPHWPAIPGYEVLKELGCGGIGVVYQARQCGLERLVAIKMLRGVGVGREELARFQSEAQTIGRLHHPGIVQIHQAGIHQGQPFFVLEHVAGGSLEQRICGQPQSPLEAARLVEALARALEYAHQRGIIHGDLKPGNILLKPRDPATSEARMALAGFVPTLTDFGLARHLGTDTGPGTPGLVLGTPSYMAPEQIGYNSQAIGPATDVYGLGAILYELLTGRPPFRAGSTLETLEQVRCQQPVPPRQLVPGLPCALETICLRALAKSPTDRYHSAQALADDLARFLAGTSILPGRASLDKGRNFLRRHSVMLTVGVCLVLLVTWVSGLLRPERHARVEHLEQALALLLDRPDFSDAGALRSDLGQEVQRLEGLLTELALLAPDRATGLRGKMIACWQRWLDQRIDARDEPAVLRGIAVARTWDPLLALELEQRLQASLERYDPVFRLTPPFENLEQVFPAGTLAVQGEQLVVQQPSPLLTRIPLSGSVEIQVIFAGQRWEESRTLGFGLRTGGVHCVDPHCGYTFQLFTQPGVKTSLVNHQPGPLRQGATVRLQILRHGQVLTEQTMDPACLLPGKDLVLWAQREGGHLRCRVNRGPVVEFIDPFPLRQAETAFLALQAAPRTALRSLSGARRAQKVGPGPLDAGDALHEGGHFAEAVDCYRSCAQQSQQPALTCAARYKEAVCLLELDRTEEALPLLDQVASNPVGRWGVLADAQLWLQALRSKNSTAHQVLAKVARRFRQRDLSYRQLAALLPEDVRGVLRHSLQPELRWLHFLASAEQIESYLPVVEMVELLDADPVPRQETSTTVLRLLRLLEQEKSAVRRGREWLEPLPPTDQTRRVGEILHHACWALRRLDRGEYALNLVQSYLNGVSPQKRELLPECARCRAALGEWQAAEADLDQVLNPPDRDQQWRAHHQAACSLKGFLCARRGDETSARRWWKLGADRHRQQRPEAVSPENEEEHFVAFFTYFQMAALAGDLRPAEASTIQKEFLNWLARGQLGPVAKVLARFPSPSVYQQLWLSPRGREIARQFSFRACSYREFLRWPLYLILHETVRQAAFGTAFSPEQDQLVWQLICDAHEAIIANELKGEALLELTRVFEGESTSLHSPWQTLSTAIPARLRAGMALVLAQRHLQLNQPRLAHNFFRAALEEAGSNATLRRLAEDGLQQVR